VTRLSLILVRTNTNVKKLSKPQFFNLHDVLVDMSCYSTDNYNVPQTPRGHVVRT